MADDLDTDSAGELQDLYLRIALGAQRPTGPRATGFCLSCEEELPGERRWCDATCRDDYERASG
jgi:hypothetical protein